MNNNEYRKSQTASEGKSALQHAARTTVGGLQIFGVRAVLVCRSQPLAGGELRRITHSSTTQREVTIKTIATYCCRLKQIYV